MSTEIINGLFVGDLGDAKTFRRDRSDVVICVLNQWPRDGDAEALWLPVVVADADDLKRPIQALLGNLNVVADIMEESVHRGARILVHCREGVERSPLAVVWFFCRKYGWTLDAAYAEVRSRRPEVIDRRSWLL